MIVLGQTNDGQRVEIDRDRLVESRLLLQANSGGGKSWALRRLLEQSFGQVQHLVLDPEGEFASLREKHDYVLAGRGGDTPAEPRSAKMLARKLLELGVSAIMDIYELKPYERVRFVRLFLEALVDAPKALWHPVLVVIDEAHVYAPEKGNAESLGAVVDLATRGRKRGYCAVLATQRISKLSKDAAAELNNKVIGRAALDIDMKRASDELGLVTREDREALRTLDPGEFFAFGPAISPTVTRLTVGGVETTHPKVGWRHAAAPPPPPTEKVRAILADLADLPAEAEREAQDLATSRKTITGLRRELSQAKRSGHDPDATAREVQRGLAAAARTIEALKQDLAKAEEVAATNAEVAVNVVELVETMTTEVREIRKSVKRTRRVPAGRQVAPKQPSAPAPLPPPAPPPSPRDQEEVAPTDQDDRLGSLDGVKSGAVRILKELAGRYPARWTRSQLATLTAFAPRGGTYGSYLSVLRVRGLVEISGQDVQVTDLGLDAVGEVPAAPTSHEEVMEMWRQSLKAGCYRLLERIIEAAETGISKDELAETAGFALSGGTFGSYLSILRRNGLVVEQDRLFRATDVLWLA